MDFLTPPSTAQIAVIRQQSEAALSRPQIQAPQPVKQAAPEPPVPAPEKRPDPAGEKNDVPPSPSLNTYAELAAKGSRHLIELATLLENAGEFPRALVAWERVIDSATPNLRQATAAIAAIKRLRAKVPLWNNNPATAIPIVINASSSSKLDKSLKPAVEQAAHDLQRASSGIMLVTTNVSIPRKTSSKNAPATVELWLTGPDDKSSSTPTLSFTVTKPEDLQADVLARIFRITSNRLGQNHAFTPVPPMAKDEAALYALAFHITRLRWQEFALSLNAPKAARPEKIDKPAATPSRRRRR